MPQPRSTPQQIQEFVPDAWPISLLLASDEFDTWAVGEDRIVKVARTAEDAEKVAFEATLHPLIRLRLGDLVPRVLGHGVIEGAPAILFERARGRQGQTMEDGAVITPGKGLAADVGGTLAALHAIDAGSAREFGARDRAVAFEPLDLAPRTVRRVEELAGSAAIEAFLSAPAPAPSDRRTLCHTDLKGEHLFVDGSAERLTAIIDWADAEVCDPAKDYAGLVIWLGPAFARAAVAASGQVDATLADRAIWLGRAGILGYWDAVLDGRETGPIPLITAQLLAAFSD